jgi:hypothetical protein
MKLTRLTLALDGLDERPDGHGAVRGHGRRALEPVYDLTSPIFSEIRIGRDLKIVTHGDPKDPYIQGARLNGRRLDNAWLYQDQLRGTLDLWLGAQPNKRWGVDELPPSESAEAKPVYATGVEIVAPVAIREPYGSTPLRARFTPASTTYQRADWSVTEPDGSPTTKATIDYDGVITVNDEEGEVLLTATGADGHGATARKRLTIDLDPGLLRGNAARRPGAVATASSEFSADYAAPSPPDMPIGVTVAGSTVSWTAPAFDGGAPLTGYVVTPYKDGTALAPVSVDEHHTSVVVGARFDRVTVRARNLIGDGPESSS